MGKALELAGQTFGRLQVLEKAATRSGSNVQWVCRCSCGKIVVVTGSNLISGNSTSCGCTHVKHGQSGGEGKTKSPEYTAWHGLIGMCYIPTDEQFHNYGGKGIGICTRWRKSFLSFLEDMGTKPPYHALGRRDSEMDFSPDNCYWRRKPHLPYESLYNAAKKATEDWKKSSRGFKFQLTYDEFLEFTKTKVCHYCGSLVTWVNSSHASYNLDRKDNAGNYDKDNCVVCCFECNATKGARFTYEEMLIIGKAVREVKLLRGNSID